MNNILKKLTTDEKITLLTGAASMETAGIGRLEIKGKCFEIKVKDQE